MDTNHINWAQVRIQASMIILAGICSNPHNTYPSTSDAEDAVMLADDLISFLAGTARNSHCVDLYQSTSPLHQDPTAEGCIEGVSD